MIVTPATPSIPVGQTLQLTATGTYDDGSHSNLNAKVTWTMSPSGLATVSPAGLLTGVSAGSIQITATQEIVSGSTSATITVPNVTGITVTPSSFSMKTGDSTCFQALAIATGQTQPEDISQTATWNVNVLGTSTPETSGISRATCTTGPGMKFTAQTPYLPQQPPNLLLDITATYLGTNGNVTSNIARLGITQ